MIFGMHHSGVFWGETEHECGTQAVSRRGASISTTHLPLVFHVGFALKLYARYQGFGSRSKSACVLQELWRGITARAQPQLSWGSPHRPRLRKAYECSLQWQEQRGTTCWDLTCPLLSSSQSSKGKMSSSACLKDAGVWGVRGCISASKGTTRP